MFRLSLPRFLFVVATLISAALAPAVSSAQASGHEWTFAVSGDSRNCGDFVMPALAAKVKAERDDFDWHLGDFRWMSQADQDLLAMEPAGTQLSKAEYQQHAWDDFLTHQMASFGSLPVFLGRGNHEDVKPMTVEGYDEKFASFLDRPEIAAQRKRQTAKRLRPWVPGTTGTHNGVDFITLGQLQPR